MDSAAFWRRVQIGEPTECWLWTGSLLPTGYGQFGSGRQGSRPAAHRASWMLHFGPIPDGLYVLHHCDVRACVNPAHLFLGTQLDNMRDMRRKGRHRFGTPPRFSRTAHPMAKLSEDQVRQIRRERIAGVKLKTLAALHNVSLAHISRLARGESWKAVASRG